VDCQTVLRKYKFCEPNTRFISDLDSLLTPSCPIQTALRNGSGEFIASHAFHNEKVVAGKDDFKLFKRTDGGLSVIKPLRLNHWKKVLNAFREMNVFHAIRNADRSEVMHLMRGTVHRHLSGDGIPIAEKYALYIVMPYAGLNFDSWVQARARIKSHITHNEIVDALNQIHIALKNLHNLGISHADFNHEQILIKDPLLQPNGKKGRIFVTLCDFDRSVAFAVMPNLKLYDYDPTKESFQLFVRLIVADKCNLINRELAMKLEDRLRETHNLCANEGRPISECHHVVDQWLKELSASK